MTQLRTSAPFRPEAPRAWVGNWTRRGVFLWLLLALGLAMIPRPVAAQTQEAELEYKVKAAFLFNFVKFTQWPTNRFAPPTPAILIGCLAEDPCAPLLARALEGKSLNGQPIRLVTFQDGDDLRKCHLFFVGRTRKSQIDDVLTRLNQAPVLTVSEVEQFGQRGGMINFFLHERTFRFEINLEAAERAHLRISSDLSSMATLVKPSRTK